MSTHSKLGANEGANELFDVRCDDRPDARPNDGSNDPSDDRSADRPANGIRERGRPPAGRWALLAAAWLALSLVGLARPLLPVDETRYAAVAWEMWQRGDFLLPVLNGQPYHHKPPLLFWLMHAGWAVFGVNDWWPRLLAPAFCAGTLALTAGLARALWPARPAVASGAPLLLLATPLFAYFASALMFDMLLAFWVALGWLGTVRGALAATGRQAALAARPAAAQAAAVPLAGGGWPAGALACLALGLAGALFAKGPVALVHLLPLALTAPWWAPGGQALRGWRWYGGVLLALALAAAAILAWALPAAQAGGPDYANAIFWNQSAGRLAASFAHQAPWFTYLVMLPVVLAPWFLWPAWWRGLAALRREWPLRFLALGAGSAFVFFSLASGKRLHYLLPELVLAALLLARALDGPLPAQRWRMAIPVLTLGVTGLGLLVGAAPLGERLGLAQADTRLLLCAGLLALVAGGWLLWSDARAQARAQAPARGPAPAPAPAPARAAAQASAQGAGQAPGRPGSDLRSDAPVDRPARPRPVDDGPQALQRVALATLLTLAGGMLALDLALRAPYDTDDVAARLSDHAAQGRPLAMAGTSHGEWTFAGRLTTPLVQVPPQEAAAWLAAHPQGRMVFIHKRPAELPAGAVVELQRRYRGSVLAILQGGPQAADASGS